MKTSKHWLMILFLVMFTVCSTAYAAASVEPEKGAVSVAPEPSPILTQPAPDHTWAVSPLVGPAGECSQCSCRIAISGMDAQICPSAPSY